MKYKDGHCANPFHELAEFALKILIIPHSNADVKRIFSQLSVTKSKLPNKMSTDTVNALLHIKYGLKRHGKCCCNCTYPLEILRKIGHIKSYKDRKGESREQVIVTDDPVPSCSYEIEELEDDVQISIRDSSDSGQE